MSIDRDTIHEQIEGYVELAEESLTAAKQARKRAADSLTAASGADDPDDVERYAYEVADAGRQANHAAGEAEEAVNDIERLIDLATSDSSSGVREPNPRPAKQYASPGKQADDQVTDAADEWGQQLGLQLEKAEHAAAEARSEAISALEKSRKAWRLVDQEHLSSGEVGHLTDKILTQIADLAAHASMFLTQDFGSLNDKGRQVMDEDAFAKVSNVTDDGIRNHLITIGFRDMGRILLGYTHGDVSSTELTFEELGRAGEKLADDGLKDFGQGNGDLPDANFATFAAWASITIGRTVRGRFAPRRFDHNTNNMIRGAAGRLAIDVRQTKGQRLSRLLAASQHRVFRDLHEAVVLLIDSTAQFDGWLDHDPEENGDKSLEDRSVVELPCGAKAVADMWLELDPMEQTARQALTYLAAIEQRIAQMNALALLEVNTPTTGRHDITPRIKSMLDGLISYYLARKATEVGAEIERLNRETGSGLPVVPWHVARSQLIFRGTMQIEGVVQEVVQVVLDYSADELARDYFDQQLGVEVSEQRGAGRWRRRLNRMAVDRFDRMLGDVWARFLTDQVLIARIGDELIRLGRDIPDPPDQPEFYPANLRDIEDQWTSNLLLRYDHSFGTGVGTRSHNWAVYDDRMNTMVSLFRSRQVSRSVWQEPFTGREEVIVRTGQEPTDSGGSTWML